MEHGLILPSTAPAIATDSRRRSNYLSDSQRPVWWLPRVPFKNFISSVTCWIMISQVVIFFASVAISNGFTPPASNSTFGPSRCALIQMGGKFSPFIVDKLEYWRIISANFVHSGLITLVLSLILEYLIIMPVEAEHGRLITATVFILSGATGYAFSAVASPTSVSTGALGPVMGLVGFRLSYAVLDWPSIPEDDRRRVGILEAGTAFIILIVGQSPFVDNYCSFAAFVIGCFIGGAFFGDKIDSTVASQRIVIVMALMATIFVLFIVGFLLGAGEFPLIHQAVYSLICKYDTNVAPFHPFDYM